MKFTKLHAILLLCTVSFTHAAVTPALLFDFGPTSATGSNLTNSPGHDASDYLSGSDTTWNTVGTSGSLSGTVSSLVDSQNNAATGISFTWGVSSAGSTDLLRYVDGGSISSSSALGSTDSAGVYAGDSVGKDAVFSGSSTSDSAVGLRLDGLGSGQYEVYLTGRNTNSSTAMNVYFGVGNPTTMDAFQVGSSNYFDYTDSFPTVGGNVLSDPGSIVTVAMSNVSTGSWIAEDNYAMTTITINSGDSLFLALDGSGSNRGFLNSLQIVPIAVPEPSVYALILGILGFGFIANRKRKRCE